MLRKPVPLVIDPDNPFAADALDRKDSAANLSELVSATGQQALVLALDGSWGTGKTTFARMWMHSLQAAGHPCIYFNAWENDFADDPMVAIIGEIQAAIDETKVDLRSNPIAAERWNKVKSVSGHVLRRTAPLAVRLLTHGVLDLDALKKVIGVKGAGEEISGFLADVTKERVDEYVASKRSAGHFRMALEVLPELSLRQRTARAQLCYS